MANNRIGLLRRIAKLKPADIAREADVTERTAYRWEAGEVQIPDEKKLLLAELFECSVAFLMGWPDAESNGENGNGEGEREATAA
jgi:transcriptional regulator with XRE-family HTH domain